jgi:hypothetical protein
MSVRSCTPPRTVVADDPASQGRRRVKGRAMEVRGLYQIHAYCAVDWHNASSSCADSRRALAHSKAFMHPGRTLHRNAATSITSGVRRKMAHGDVGLLWGQNALRHERTIADERASSEHLAAHYESSNLSLSATSSGHSSNFLADFGHGLWENRTRAAI